MKRSILFIVFLMLCGAVWAQNSREVLGRVQGADGVMLPGASVVIKGTRQGTMSDSLGRFRLLVPSDTAMLTVSFIGYVTKELRASLGKRMEIVLAVSSSQLGEVIVSIGYQQLPKERATGSFAQIDQKLFNRSVGPDLISRLADVTPGLIFNRGIVKPGSQTNISIRGQSTIFAKADPLIVLDNFPYTGDLNAINPNDIESVTVLKDAAAASIWGAQSANGVIVITTKKATYEQPLRVSLNTNVTVSQKPDPFYLPRMSSSEVIDMEQLLFSRGYYRNAENSPSKPALSPVVELLIAARDGKIPAESASAQIDALRNIDVRNDFSKYLYRNSVNQQYALSMQGGGKASRFHISAGYDKGLSSQVGNSSGRVTVSANNDLTLLKGKAELSTGIYFTRQRLEDNALGVSYLNLTSTSSIYPYASFTDAAGRPAKLNHYYRNGFLDDAASKGLLDWGFVPLGEMGYRNYQTKQLDYRINTGLRYKILPGLRAEGLFQYTGSSTRGWRQQNQNSWTVRDLVNRFTIASETGLIRPVPLGDILDQSALDVSGYFARAQLDFDRTISAKHQLTAIAGAEVRDLGTKSSGWRSYGYDDGLGSFQQVDYLSTFKSYVNPASASNRIPQYGGMTSLTDRFVSYYANAAYIFDGKYMISASGRKDMSNLFGVNANQRGVPLYSVGFGWNVHQEKFFHAKWLPQLKLRATYGYNGNIDRTLSAYTTAYYSIASQSEIGLPYSLIRNPPNPDLRWERVRVMNFGLDFKTAAGRVSGSIEYYSKKGVDLIGDAPLAPQTGLTSFRGNTANTSGRGIDVLVTSNNFQGKFSWQTQWILSYASIKVSKYLPKSSNLRGDYVVSANGYPTQGRYLTGMYSLASAGLDPENGDPRGFLEGQVSKNYAALLAVPDLNTLVYHGSSRPLVFGGLRNTVSWHNWSLSANIAYRLAYYVRLPSVLYSQVLTGVTAHGDFSKRWKEPGDELRTHVPSLPAATNSNRDLFYSGSEDLVERADHVRLQDIRAAYSWSAPAGGSFVRDFEIYAYAANLGVIWKKMKGGLDPDFVDTTPPQRSISLGIRANF
ncbi:SusC/RagA family TonB-linked outer membrane protein [Dyadobacter sp. CY261]|uniref:SusC/RagA family TonB-linked outer membrane protein n=1 Tax=Dyadobacter sp. CY261 TaxID=2907203 RepID=UPI001F3CDE6D|nr:SusC/RagA family TonB-linked outer membrane protein [Dyadobacter sp. CY261]MCF0075409.1 SusC/RagA family TonB-linked outer membrane protein [Dyadobacter sp. CY261]